MTLIANANCRLLCVIVHKIKSILGSVIMMGVVLLNVVLLGVVLLNVVLQNVTAPLKENWTLSKWSRSLSSFFQIFISCL
jgi:hypothetical protein